MKNKIFTLALGALFIASIFNGVSLFNKDNTAIVYAEEDYYKDVDTTTYGSPLKKKLKSIISNGHSPKKGYDNIEEAMLFTDRNWTLSPDKNDDNPYMVLLYADKYNVSNPQRFKTCQGKYGVTDGYVWNKEHILPQSMGAGSAPAKNDLHHLRASDYNVNNKRGNNPFGKKTTSAEAVVDKLKNTTENYVGGGYCEPAPEFRGDIARALFYMATRYDSTFNSSEYSTLLEWHEQDPVDDFEANRNDLVQEWQGNRNPYIDHPEYAKAVFNNEPIEEPAELVSLTLTGQPTKTQYKEGENFDPTGLTVTAHYDNDKDINVTSSVSWSPKPLAGGTTAVTGTFKNKTVTVTGISVVALIELRVIGAPIKTTYEAGESFDPTGLTVEANYGSFTENVTNLVTWSPNPLTAGTTEVVGTYGIRTFTVSGLTVTAPKFKEYRVDFKANSNDGSQAFSSSEGVFEEVSEGGEFISSFAVNTGNPVYSGKAGLKFGSSSKKGKLTVNLETEYSADVSKITIGVNKYGSDTTPSIKISAGEESESFNNELIAGETTEYTLKVTANSTPSFVIESTSDRFYLSYIIVSIGEEEEPVDPVNPVDPTNPTDPTDPEEPVTPQPTETKKGCGGDIGTSSIILSIVALSALSLILMSALLRKLNKNKARK